MIRGKMGIIKFFKNLFSTAHESAHNYIPSMMPFLELDIDKIKKDMRLSENGKLRGEKNEPQTESTIYDDMEHEIIMLIESEKKRSIQSYLDSLKTYADRLRSLDIEASISEISATAKEAIVDFKAQVHDGLDQLHQLRRQVVEIEKEKEIFIKIHELNRTASFPQSRILHIGIAFTLLSVESLINGNFLSLGSEFGLLGGVMDALAISALNVGVGMFVGIKIFPNLFHKNNVRKLAGAIGVILFFGFALIFNIVVAHYRDALGGEFPQTAAKLAIKSFHDSPLNISDFKSLMMLWAGLSFSLIAAADGFYMDDRYPGYGKMERRRSEILQDYTDQKSDLMEVLGNTKDNASEEMKKAETEIMFRRKEYYSILDARDRMEASFKSHIKYLEDCSNNLLSVYREANKAVRTVSAPNHFNEHFILKAPADTDIGYPRDTTINDLEEKVKRSTNSLIRRIGNVLKEYERAVERYKQIEQLTLEDFRNGQ